MLFYLTLAMRFTDLLIKQASRKSTTGQCLLIKAGHAKERQAKREREAEKVMVSFSLSLFLSLSFLLSVSSFHIYMKEKVKERRRVQRVWQASL